jgi:hypothetical protein
LGRTRARACPCPPNKNQPAEGLRGAHFTFAVHGIVEATDRRYEREAVLDHTSGCNVDIRYPASAPSTTSAGSPSIASDGDQIEVAHAKAARAAATVLEGCDNLCAGLIFADCSRAEDPDIVFIQRACALAIHDGLANDLVGHGQFPSAVRWHSLPLLRWPQLQSLS